MPEEIAINIKNMSENLQVQVNRFFIATGIVKNSRKDAVLPANTFMIFLLPRFRVKNFKNVEERF